MKTPPPIDPEVEEERAAKKRWREEKSWRKPMGEAKDIVGAAPAPADRSQSPDRKDSPDTPFKVRRRLRPAGTGTGTGTGVLGELSQTVDQLDRAIEVKLIDLDNEPTSIAENHVKLGLLRGASALIRRAKAMLEDYGKDLKEDLDPATDAEN
jgi:hypothetical protein